MLSTSVLFAFAHFRLVYSLDYCEQIIQVTDQNRIPTIGTGVATALSCMPDDANDFSSSLSYKLYNEYQKCLILSNDRLFDLSPNATALTTLSDFTALSPPL